MAVFDPAAPVPHAEGLGNLPDVRHAGTLAAVLDAYNFGLIEDAP